MPLMQATMEGPCRGGEQNDRGKNGAAEGSAFGSAE